jgi:hypothetical protein
VGVPAISENRSMKSLPLFIDEMLAAPPRAGEGVHDWLFRVARQLHAHLPAVEIVALLESRVQNCGRHVNRKEIEDAVKNSIPCAWQPKGNAAPVQSAAKWPKVNQEQRAAILRDGGGLARDDKAKDYAQAFEELLAVLPTGDDAPALGIVAHTRKPRAEERANGRALLNLLAGSYVIGSVPRAVFIMQAASDDTTDSRIVWTCCKNNDGEMGKRSAWERRNGLFIPVQDFDWKTFEGDGEKRRTVSLADLDTLFESGRRQLARSTAVEQLIEQTKLGKTACYQALKAGGKFSQNLTDQDGLLNFKP